MLVDALQNATAGSAPEFLLGAPERADDLERYLAPREQGLGELDWILEAGDRHPMRIAREILTALDDLEAAVTR